MRKRSGREIAGRHKTVPDSKGVTPVCRKRGKKIVFVLAAGVTLAAFFLMGPFSPFGLLFPAKLTIQHPLAGAVMPANMPGPAVIWPTNQAGVGSWSVVFKAGGKAWAFNDVHSFWRPPETDWALIKEAAKGTSIELVVAGYKQANRSGVEVQGTVKFTISTASVKSPLFYRDVNLPFAEAIKDTTKIRWRFGAMDKGTPAPVVLENLVVCGNCHSFSQKGEHLAMDVDYGNDKGSYVILRTASQMRLATSDIITWDSYRREDGQSTLGLLSQISPDGRYVLSTVKDLSVFMPKPDLAFSQLFFPFMGIIAVYDRETRQFSSLPGADDPAFVQSNPVWSPDGKWIVFARTRAVALKNAQKKGLVMLNRDEDEELYQQTREYRYDLYRLPFNAGKGGKAEPLTGASANGRSNYFPKYSPDGRWIAFCQASNYMLLQPDSEIFIIPAQGGTAQRLGCNLSRMNSWHSWSPDSQWMLFSSKAHSDYTQLYLARINEQGEASVPVCLAHMMEPGRAANIPEFVDLPADGIVKILPEFIDDDSYVRAAHAFMRADEKANAVGQLKIALSMNPNNATAHQEMGLLLDDTQKEEAFAHLREAARLNAKDPVTQYALGCALAKRGELGEAILHLEEGVRHLSTNRNIPQYDAFDSKRRLPELMHFKLGLAYGLSGNPAAAEQQYREALRIAPDYAEAQHNLRVMQQRGDFTSRKAKP